MPLWRTPQQARASAHAAAPPRAPPADDGRLVQCPTGAHHYVQQTETARGGDSLTV